MSLRIKLPAKAPEVESQGQLSGSEPPPNRRKIRKRHLTVNSDEDEGENGPRYTSTSRSSPPRAQSPWDSRTEEEGESESDREGGVSLDADSRFLHQPNLRKQPSPKYHAKKVKLQSDGPPAKKKRVVSEPESDEDHDFDAGDLMDEEDDFGVQHKKSTKTKGRGKPGTKRKGISSNIETVKEERKVYPGRISGEPAETGLPLGSHRPRPRQSTKAEEIIDVVGDSTPDPSAPHNPPQPKDSSPPPPAKKRKLPTIKKNKVLNSAGPSTPINASASSKSAPPGPLKPGLPEGSQLPTTGIRKPAATAGNADFDLRNASVYRELFKPAGGSTPRSGLNRREKDEERRKELNKMRDESRAMRAMEMKQTFDLQGQLEKISRFEEKLRYDRSSALYPNFLAGKWREQWERERRKQQREAEQRQNGTWVETAEEGEMNDD